MRLSDKHIRIVLLAALVFCCQLDLSAQRKVQVVTKTVSQKLEDALDSGIVIEGKKASVEVTGWDRDYSLVEIDLISKHQNVDVAISELDYIQYVISKTSTHYILRNSFFATDSKKKIKGSLSVAYRVYVPLNTKVHVNDQYGEVKLVNLFGKVDLDVDFCDVQFERLFGNVQAKANYSEFKGKDFDGSFDLQSKRTEIELTDFAGNVVVDNNYGDIRLRPSSLLKVMQVSSRHGKVELLVNSLDAFNYDVRVNSSYIDLPADESALVKKDESGNNYSFEKKNGLHKANIKIANLMFPVRIYADNK